MTCTCMWMFQVLAQELGDQVDIKSVLNTPGNWKGRAQQIVNLTKRVRNKVCSEYPG